MTDPPDGESSPLSWKTRDRYRTSRPRAAPTTEDVEELARLRRALQQMGTEDDCAMLGIAQDATAEAAAAAFREMTRFYHPDLFSRYGDPAIKQTATEIFVLLRHASARIRERELRRAKEAPAAPKLGEHDARPDGGRRSSAPPSTTEERFAEALRHAAHHRDREAELLLLIALADQPDNATGKVWLLTVQARQAKAANKLDEAADRYEAVLRLEPHNVEATYELHSLPGTWRRAKAMLGRLWKGGGSGG